MDHRVAAICQMSARLPESNSLTIISEEGLSARALYLAEAKGYDAIAISVPVNAGFWEKTKLTLREWLARDLMILYDWL